MSYARVLKVPQYFRNIHRLSEIVRVFVKHGFGDLINRLNIAPYLESGLKLVYPAFPANNSGLSFDVRLRRSFEELGPAFIKFGQIMAARSDILPLNLTAELRKLEDEVPPFPSDEARKVIECELGRPINELFQSFSDEPIAAASIAQVHKAELSGGKKVAVKVQRPGLDKILATDIEILTGFAALLDENIPESRIYSPRELVEEFSRGLKKERDFLREAQNIKRFAAQFDDEPNIAVPKVYSELSTQLVLTEEYISGWKASELHLADTGDLDRTAAAQTLCRVVLRSIFEYGFFHADPHGGNILITPEGKVALLDFGMMGRLDKTRIDQILHFLVALFAKDLDKMLRVLHEAKVAPMYLDEVSLKSQISEIIDHYLDRNLEDLDLAALLMEVFEVIQRYGVRPPPDLLLIAKALTTLATLASEIDPAFVPVDEVKPYLLERYVAHLTDPKLYAAYITDVVDSYRRFITDFPNELRVIMRNLARGDLKIMAGSTDLDTVLKHQNRIVNRIILTSASVCFSLLGLVLFVSGSGKTAAAAAYMFTGLAAASFFFLWMAVRKSGGA